MADISQFEPQLNGSRTVQESDKIYQESDVIQESAEIYHEYLAKTFTSHFLILKINHHE